jgi:cation diffusion facilitator CzcD-associated flavoprotein CzcO
MSNTEAQTRKCDVFVIGAGFSGMHALYRFREMGLNVICVEAGDGVGGTWYWNRYPGARVDCQIPVYQYTFARELFDEWEWSELFPAQPETEQYLNFVADRLDLRKDIQFNTTVTSAKFDESTRRWLITTAAGEAFEAPYFVPCVGLLSASVVPFEGKEKFKGLICHTSRWPKEPVDFTDKRVGVVGNGATGMQVIQTIAPEVAHLKVFMRTAQFAIDLKNPKLTDADRAGFREHYAEIVETCSKSFGGLHFDAENGSFYDHTPEQRREIYERIWADGSLKFWIGTFMEVLTDEDANAEISDFVREKIRAHIKDPKLADKLVPTYRFGTRRVPLQLGYFDAFNRDNVELVDVNADPIDCITENGLKLTSGEEHAVDILIMATGFDGVSGALSRIDIRGRNNQSLAGEWHKDIRTTMGLQVHGFPNMFTPGAPLAPIAAFCNVPTCSQQQVNWIADTIGYLRDHDLQVIEPTAETEKAWVTLHDEIVNASLFPKTRGWYMGDNIEGKPRRLLAYLGGVPDYEQRCEEAKENNYQGFALR